MFKEVLQQVVDNTEGGVAGVVMGFDGIMVDSYASESEPEAVNVETIGMEYSVVLSQVKKAAQMLEIGDTREVAIRAEQVTTLVRLINDEYFVALTLQPSGNLGKARYLLRLNASKLAGELA